ncbi:MAG: hypothetical protein RR365_02185 [Bacteroides sp.]
MKRELLQNIKVQPYTSGAAVERTGFLSGIIGAAIGTAGALTLTVTHSDDGSTFGVVSDKQLFPEKQTEKGVFTTEVLGVGDVVNIDVDLSGLKSFVKVTASGTAATSTTLALALGDKNIQPV